MSYSDQFERDEKEGYIKRIADNIQQGIDKIREKPEISSKRWLWELMQNARDARNFWNKVSIKIILDHKSIKICHNGAPFTTKNLTNIIQQVSSKIEDSDEDFIGKFGTGFLVTHLLSSKLNLSGVLQNDGLQPYKFNITIDRSNKNNSLKDNILDLLKSIKNIEDKNIYEKIENYNPNKEDFDTIFEYPLDEISIEFAKNGIKDLVNTLPQTLIFVDKVETVTVIDNIKNKSYSFTKEFNANNSTYKIKSKDEEFCFWIKSNEKLQIALKVNDTTDFHLVKWSDKTPKLYRDFPLIGSDNFHIPFLINSSNFYPNEERSGLMLVDTQNEKVLINRNLIEEAFKLAQEFIIELKEKHTYKNSFLLANSKIPNFDNIAVKEWYKLNIRNPYREFITQNLIVENNSNTSILVKDLKVPYYDKDANAELQTNFFNICSPFYDRRNIPLLETYRQWVEIVEYDYEDWYTDLKITLSNLMDKLITKGHIVPHNNEEIVAMNNLYEFLYNNGKHEAISLRKIIPNTNGDFDVLKNLYVNRETQEQFIKIIELDKPNFRENIVLEGINIPVEANILTSKEVIKQLNELIKEDDYGDDPDEIELIYQFLSLQISDTITIQKNVYERFCLIFNRKEFNVKIKSEKEDFDFSILIEKAIKLIFSKIENKATLHSLLESINLPEYNIQQLENSLSNFYYILANSKRYNYLLNEYSIFPNFIDEFIKKENGFIFKYEDLNLDSDIIELYNKLLPKNEFKTKLIKSKYYIDGLISQLSVSNFFIDIENKIKYFYENWAEISINEKHLVINLLEWTSLNKFNSKIAETYLQWITMHKPNILMLQIENNEVKNAMFKILKSDDDKIIAIGDLVENRTVEEINEFAYFYSEMQEAIDTIGLENVKDLINEKVEEKRDFIFKKSIGNSFETVIQKILTDQNLNYNLKKIEGDADFVLLHNGKSFYLELKSLAHNSTDKIKFSYNQINTAYNNRKNYAVCFIKRSEDWNYRVKSDIADSFVKENAKVLLNLGDVVNDGFELAKKFKENLITEEVEGIGVVLKDNNFKFSINNKTRNTNSVDFSHLITAIKEYLS